MNSKKGNSKKSERQVNITLPEDEPLGNSQIIRNLIKVEEVENEQSIPNNNDQLQKVYIEVTNACNLECRTCMRNVWNEPIGYMGEITFSKIMDGLQQFLIKPLVFFGGYGEPFAHPKILKLIEIARKQGYCVELITNGTLLDSSISATLIDLCVERVWVSIDGSTPESYADIRLGDELPMVIENLETFQKLRNNTPANHTNLGIAIVAMKRNICDLPNVIQLGKRLGADKFSISNVLAHTKALKEEVLYQKSLYCQWNSTIDRLPMIQLPRMDIDPITVPFLKYVSNDRINTRLSGQKSPKEGKACPFIDKFSTSIRWDGKVSPCLPLLHTHVSYLDDNQRKSYAFSLGDIMENQLIKIWNDPLYNRLRDRLRIFDYSPCTSCNSCFMAEANLEDCFGNVQPACGGCLWAQGFIQCP